ncbi:hypothetical protein I316_03362 [Kwoniella heveanensis BCC8398]|uniref:Uncharacterized protein n=1 Tax=Kwoniella heveanensis BCC8398 TaxID=1296120 RepID=A0A1B9GUX1_9TREE|nr:hypothetical protein I316_03362 [Kwoniella heveanensis BCC8398]
MFFFLLAMISYFSSLVVFSSIVSYFYPAFAQTPSQPASTVIECDAQTVRRGSYSYPTATTSIDDNDDDNSADGYYVPGNEYSGIQDNHYRAGGAVELELEVEVEVEVCASRLPSNLLVVLRTLSCYDLISHLSYPCFRLPLPHPYGERALSTIVRPTTVSPSALQMDNSRIHCSQATNTTMMQSLEKWALRWYGTGMSLFAGLGYGGGGVFTRTGGAFQRVEVKSNKVHPLPLHSAFFLSKLSSPSDHEVQVLQGFGPKLSYDWAKAAIKREVPAIPTFRRGTHDSPIHPPDVGFERKRRRQEEVTPPLESIAKGYKLVTSAGQNVKKFKVDDVCTGGSRQKSVQTKGTMALRARSWPVNDGARARGHTTPRHPTGTSTVGRLRASYSSPTSPPVLGRSAGTHFRRSAPRTRQVRTSKSPRSVCSISTSTSNPSSSRWHGQVPIRRKRSRPRSLSPLEHAQRGQSKRRRLTRTRELAIYQHKSPSSTSHDPGLGSVVCAGSSDEEPTRDSLVKTSALPTPGLCGTGSSASDVGREAVLVTPVTEKMAASVDVGYTPRPWVRQQMSSNVPPPTPAITSGQPLPRAPGSMKHTARRDAPAPLTLTNESFIADIKGLRHLAPTQTSETAKSSTLSSPSALHPMPLAGLTVQERAELRSFVSQYPDGLAEVDTPQSPRSPISPASSKFPIASPPVSPVAPTCPTSVTAAKKVPKGFRRRATSASAATADLSRRRESLGSGSGADASSTISPASSSAKATQGEQTKRLSEHRIKKYRRLLYHLNMPPPARDTKSTDSLQSRRYDLVVYLLNALGMDKMPRTFATPSPEAMPVTLSSPVSSGPEDKSTILPSLTGKPSSLLRPSTAKHLTRSTIAALVKVFVNTSEPINVLARYLKVDHLSPREKRRAMACLDAYAAWRDGVQRRVDRRLEDALAFDGRTESNKKRKRTIAERSEINLSMGILGSDVAAVMATERMKSRSGTKAVQMDRVAVTVEAEGLLSESVVHGDGNEDGDGDASGWYDLAVAHMVSSETRSSSRSI